MIFEKRLRKNISSTLCRSDFTAITRGDFIVSELIAINMALEGKIGCEHMCSRANGTPPFITRYQS